MAMMGNWDTVLQYQEDYANGFTIGSAQREQEKYLDSIEGKWNTLKENLKNLVTTTISSDFAKGLLDGAISITDGLNSAFKILDEFNAVLPTTIGLITTLGQSFKVLSGNGTVSVFGSGLISGIKELNNALKGDSINYSATSNGIQKLASNQIKLSTSTTKTSDSFKQYSLRVGDANKSVVRINRENTNLAKNQAKISGGVKNLASSFAQSAAGSKLAMVGTSLLNGALIGLASWGIGQAIKAFDEYINRHEIAAEKARESIDVINGDIQGYQSQKKSLESISKEYDELASKTNKSASELERFSELKNEIAEIMPNLVLGYDEKNDPILAMNGNVQTLIGELDRAIESKQRLLESKEGDLGINATENIKKAAKELQSSYASMNLALNKGDRKSNEALSSAGVFGQVSIEKRTQKVIKALEDEEKAYTEKYNEHLQNLEEYYAREQEIQKKNLNELFKKDSYKSLQDDLKGNVNSFAAMFDWGEYDLSGQRQMVSGIEKLSKALSEGKIDLEDFNTRWQSINDTFQNTGDIDQYNKSINELAKELENVTGVDAGKWIEGLNQQFEGLSYADAKLNEFLQSYGSSLDKLRNGDSIAIALQKQYDELINFSDLINSEFIATGKVSVELLTEIKESESFKYLPQQIQTTIDAIISDNKVTEAEQDILLRLKTIIQNEGALDDGVSEQLNRLFQGKSTQQELQIGIKIGDYHIPPELMKILNSEYEGKNVNINFKAKADTQDAVNKLEEIDSKQNDLDGKETKSTHTVKTEGAEEVKKEVDEINKSKEELEKPSKLTINKGELQGSVDEFSKLVEYSTKLKDGEYQISFKSDTADAITQIENLKLAVNNLSNQFMQIPSTTVNLHTAQAAKNLSGLITRINQTKGALDTLSSKNVNINTAQSAKNLSGLIARVNQYKEAADNVKTVTFNSETAQAAKNMTGLINKINATNTAASSTKPITFKTNANTIASQIKSLVNTIKNVPTSKTISLKVNKNSNTDSLSSRNLISPLADFNSQIQSDTLAVQRSIRKGFDSATDLMPTNLSRATVKTPLALDGSDIANSMKYSIELLKELENRLKMVSNELSIVDKKMKHATNSEKIKYLKEQNKLYEENIAILKEQSSAYEKQKNYYEYFLKNKGFTFNSDGNMTNYEEKLIAMEKEKERLDKIAEDKQKASSDYKGDDEKQKDKLSKAYEEAKKKADEYGESLTEIKKYADEYFNVAFTEIPGVTEELIEMNNAIKDNIQSIKDFEEEIKNLRNDSRHKDENRDISEVQNKLDKNDILLETAVGKEREKLLKERIQLQEQLKKETQDLLSVENQYRNTLMSELGSYGFTFRDDGSIEGYGQKIEALKQSLTEAEFDKVFDKIEEYISTTYNTIPSLENDILNLGNTILNTVNDLEQVKIEQIDRDIERADEDELLGLLNQKLELQQELVNKKQDYVGLLNEEADKMKELLSDKGFTFDDEGTITNLEENIKRLNEEIKNTNDISLKNKLIKELQGALDCTDEYVKVTESEIPKAIEQWKDAQAAVKDTEKEIEDIEKAQAKFAEDRAKAVRKATEDIMKVTQELIQTQMDINRKQITILENSMKLSSFDVTQSYESLQKQISLLEKQINLQTQMNSEIEKQKQYYQNRLVTFGIQFDSNGIATNAEKVLNDIKNQMAKASDADELEKLEDKFNDIVDVLGDYNNALENIVSGQSDLIDLKLEIQDIYESMLETTKKIEDKITNIIEKQVEERKKLIDSELKKRLDSLKKEQEAYNKSREEEKYAEKYEDKLKEISDLKAKIEAISKDSSLAGQAKLAELLKELADKQKEFDDMVQDKLDQEINNKFQEEQDRLNEEADKVKEELDKTLEKEELYETIKDALETGTIKDIDGNIIDLKEAILDYEDKYGDGLSVIGGLIKKDLLSQLDISLDTMKNIESILKNLNISDFYQRTSVRDAVAVDFNGLSSRSMNYEINFNESLITVEGNVSSETIPELKNMVKEAEKRITRNIIESMR